MRTVDLPSCFSGGWVPGGRHMRRCPGSLHANGDRHPSLSIKIRENGTWLLHCHSGCDPAEILPAVGLAFSDCFPDDFQPRPGSRNSRHRLTHREALLMLRREAFLVAIAANNVRAQIPLDDAEIEQLTAAAVRATQGSELAGVHDG